MNTYYQPQRINVRRPVRYAGMAFRTSPHRIAYSMRRKASLSFFEFASNVEIAECYVCDDLIALAVACPVY